MNNSRALIIFAKQPATGRVKTRLTPPLSPGEAAELYRCMLCDTLAKVRRLPGIVPVIFYQDDPGAGEYFQSLAPEMEALPQRGSDLGERMQLAFAEMFGRGHAEVAIIGSDSPDLPGEFIVRSFRLLADGGKDLVVGPTEDNGYYLLAMRRVWRELFHAMPWSTAEVLPLTLARADSAGISTGLLPVWYDIDAAADLRRPELADERNDAFLTREFLAKLVDKTVQLNQ